MCANVVDMPFAYVVYDHARPKNIAIIREWLKQQDIVLVGRYSEWEYYNSDHAFLAGKRGAEEVRKLQQFGTTRATTTRIVDPIDRASEKGWRNIASSTHAASRSPQKEARANTSSAASGAMFLACTHARNMSRGT